MRHRHTLTGRAGSALGALALSAASLLSCTPRPQILAPADQASIALDGSAAVQVELGQVIEAARVRITLLRGIDAPPSEVTNLSTLGRVTVDGSTATAQLSAADLAPGRNTLFVSLDPDGDGHPDNVMSSTFRWDPLRAAACKRKITPVVGENHSDPIYMAGFDVRNPTGVHDDLWARGYVVQNANKKIAIVTLDLVGYFYNEIQTIRSDAALAGLGFDAIMVTSTHEHEGPDTMGLWGPNETTTGVDLGYLDFVNSQVVACIVEANQNLEPAEMRFATGSTVGTSLPPNTDLVNDGRVLQPYVIPGDAFNPPRAADVIVEGDPGKIINPSVPALQIRSRMSGQILATAVNFASHPESLGSDNTLITSDFPHFMRQALESHYGGIAIYQAADLGVLQGPLDVDITDPATGQPAARRTFRFAEVMGNKLAERAQLALDAAASWDANPALDARSTGQIQVRVENPYFIAGGLYGVFGRRKLERDAQRRYVVSTEVNALRIGPAQMAVTPNELDPQIGNGYRDLMSGAEHRWLLGLGNDEVGYQLPAAKFNPSCHACASYVIFDDVEECPIAIAIGVDAVDCDTIFVNNIGPGADGLLQGYVQSLLGELNAP